MWAGSIDDLTCMRSPGVEFRMVSSSLERSVVPSPSHIEGRYLDVGPRLFAFGLVFLVGVVSQSHLWSVRMVDVSPPTLGVLRRVLIVG